MAHKQLLRFATARLMRRRRILSLFFIHRLEFLSLMDFPRYKAKPQISPLRCAPVEMTKGRVAMARSRGLGMGKPQVPPLRSPGFPVETRGVEDLHAALSTESRTRGRR